MRNKDFKKLNAKKDAQTIKEEYMAGKHTNLTDYQLKKICKNSRDGGSVRVGRSMTQQEMLDRYEKLQQEAQNTKPKKKNIFDKIAEYFN
jgi:hypothetical protein